jgi:hypothetical protein
MTEVGRTTHAVDRVVGFLGGGEGSLLASHIWE